MQTSSAISVVLALLAIAAISVRIADGRRMPVWAPHGRVYAAGARPDHHWGERDVFHGDFSVDESQLGGKVVVFKIPSLLGKVSKQDLPAGMKIFINDIEGGQPTYSHVSSERYHW